MAPENETIRTLRCRNEDVPEVLLRLLEAITAQGGFVGDVRLISHDGRLEERDISVRAGSDAEMEKILQAARANPGTSRVDVRDEILEVHLGGKVAVRSRYQVDSIQTLRRVYTPGVAKVCLKIAQDASAARSYTSISNSVAIVTDGTAILGLGDIGPVAGMPVMEGKAMLLDTLVGLSAVPILLDTKDPQEIIDAVAAIAPTFAAIQLEDISAPRCFDIEARLQMRLKIPVMHDDQHGTAAVTMGAILAICTNTGIFLKDQVIGQVGLGAAGMAIAQMLMQYTGKRVLGADISEAARRRFEEMGGSSATLEEVLAKANIVIATTGVPGLIKAQKIRRGQFILALSNPDPEISPAEALAAGAAVAVDGRSVNNVLGFPGILRGAVDAQVPYISHEMYLAAAERIAALTPPGKTTPDPLDKQFHREIAAAVAGKAREQGLAGTDFIPCLMINAGISQSI